MSVLPIDPSRFYANSEKYRETAYPFESQSPVSTTDTLVKAPQNDPFGKPITKTTVAPTPSLTTEQKMFGEVEVPCFDLSDIHSEVEIRILMETWMKVGFIGVKSSSLEPYIDRVYDVMRKYFNQPLDLKMRDWHGNNGQTGFGPEGLEAAKGRKVSDRKQTFFISPDMSKWPAGMLEFKEAIEAYRNELKKYISKFLDCFLAYTKVKVCNVDDMLNSSNNLLRLAYYPAPRSTDDPEMKGAAAHEDVNWATFMPRPTDKGLKLLPKEDKTKDDETKEDETKEDRWKSVVVPKGYILINTGELAALLTNNEDFKAITHRVDNVGERYSMPFFASFPPEYDLGKYTVGEHLQSRLIEMGSVPLENITEETVKHLREVGLLQAPRKELVDKYPQYFKLV